MDIDDIPLPKRKKSGDVVRQHIQPSPEEELKPPKKKHRVSEEETEQPEAPSGVRTVDVAGIQRRVNRLLKLSTFEPEYHHWLDTGSPELNAALGSRDKGLPYGKLYELFGIEHGGKTAIATVLAGMAQKDGAAVGYIDLEDSRDFKWAGKLGLQYENVVPIYPKLVQGKKKDDPPRLESAEELFAEAEATMRLFKEAGFEKQFWILDSIANVATQMSVETELRDHNMRTKLDRAAFLSVVLPRWVGYASNYQAMIVMINQIRLQPGVVYGNPEVTPGGRAVKHTCGVRAKVSRLSNGKITNNGKVIGITGKIQNEKNKAGEGSCQGDTVGFRIKWNRPSARLEFMSVKEAEAVLKGERD